MTANPFKSAHGLAQASVACLIVVITCYFLEVIYSIAFVAFFPNLGESEDMSASETVMSLLALGIIAVKVLFFIATVVSFLMWLYRAYKNLEAFNVQNLNTSAGWAVGYWFIPILNLFKPLKVVNELYHGSNPETAEQGYAFSDTGTPAIHGFWWACWILSNFANRIASAIEKSAKDVTNSSVLFDVISLSLGIMAGVLLIFIIRDIDERQRLFEQQLSISTPPMPPVFNQQNQTF
jgi:hypothetical protein